MIHTTEMMMAGLTVNLLGLPTDTTPTAEKYRKYFFNVERAIWDGGTAGGSFVYHDDGGSKWAMTLSSCAGLGISLDFSSDRIDSNGREVFVSVADGAKMDDFIDSGDSIILPSGSFLAPDLAWLAVEDFIRSPTEKSDRIDWVSSSQLNWPEI